MQIDIYLGNENNLYSKRHRHREPNPAITVKGRLESQLAVLLPPLTGAKGLETLGGHLGDTSRNSIRPREQDQILPKF